MIDIGVTLLKYFVVNDVISVVAYIGFINVYKDISCRELSFMPFSINNDIFRLGKQIVLQLLSYFIANSAQIRLNLRNEIEITFSFFFGFLNDLFY